MSKNKVIPIASASRLYCIECHAMSDLVLAERGPDCDAALLACGHSRGEYLPPAGLSVEHVGTPEGVAAFPGDAKKFPFTGTVRERWGLRTRKR
jgi:hypothetical protein